MTTGARPAASFSGGRTASYIDTTAYEEKGGEKGAQEVTYLTLVVMALTAQRGEVGDDGEVLGGARPAQTKKRTMTVIQSTPARFRG